MLRTYFATTARYDGHGHGHRTGDSKTATQSPHAIVSSDAATPARDPFHLNIDVRKDTIMTPTHNNKFFFDLWTVGWNAVNPFGTGT